MDRPGSGAGGDQGSSGQNPNSPLLRNNRAFNSYGSVPRDTPASNSGGAAHATSARSPTPPRYYALRRRYTQSYRLPKHARPPLLVALFRKPVRLIPIVLVIAVVVGFIVTFPKNFDLPGSRPGLDPHRPIRYKKSSFDWASVEHKHPIPDGERKRIPEGPAKELKRVQYDFGPTYASDPATESRRTAVRRAAKASWLAYVEKAWGRDSLRPVSGAGKDNHAGWALTLVEALDTLWMMDLKNEFHQAAALAVEIDFGRSPASGLWTVDLATRYLGGYLGAYELSGLHPLLLKAKEVGEMVYLAFDTRDHMPTDWFSFEGAKTGRLTPSPRTESRLAGLVVELTRLAQITNDNRYYDAGDRLMAFLASTQMETRMPGLWPEQLDFKSMRTSQNNVFSVSHVSAALYEALPTLYLLTGGLEERYAEMYRHAASTIKDDLFWRPMLPGNDDIVFPGTLYAHRDRTDLVAQSTSTGCALASVLAVGGKLFAHTSHVDLAARLAASCVWAHGRFPTHLMPRTFNMIRCPTLAGCEWDEREWLDERRDRRLRESFTHCPDRRYLHSPETARSLFVLWRVTGRKELRDQAFALFEKMLTETQVRYGYADVEDVLGVAEGQGDGMIDLIESDWLGSTLKFFYLIYAHPDYLDLEDWVFSTTGHPFKRPLGTDLGEKSGAETNAGGW